ncbi:hypothetical protein PVAND_007270 [Polypedilum vanderplanki]|uniref:Uncharacterized protein n=1 Tax=Polypedilum vanderplanki TaxID=319348 RepID=A0A9J6C6R8_POLVA|nr:hypothetical protein PVAND_007270 [Polypedilum vanderplanki]
MKLKTILICVVLFCAVYSLPTRKHHDKNKHDKEVENESDYIYTGSSNKNYKPMIDEDKILRSSSYYQFLPMGFVANEKPIMAVDQHPHHGSSLLNLNIHQLLEPFMLITFLVFVLCLLDKSKVLTPISRLDLDIPSQAVEYEGYMNYLKRNHTSDF